METNTAKANDAATPAVVDITEPAVVHNVTPAVENTESSAIITSSIVNATVLPPGLQATQVSFNVTSPELERRREPGKFHFNTSFDPGENGPCKQRW